MTSPVHSGRITTPVPASAGTPTEVAKEPSTSQRQLEGPSGLSSRTSSGRQHSISHSQRHRQPLPDVANASSDQTGRRLLNSGERSDSMHFSSMERGRQLSSGSLALEGDPSSSHGSSRFDGIQSESSSIRRWAEGVQPPRAQLRDIDIEAQHDLPKLEQPEPKRSWMAVGAALVGGLKSAGQFALNELSVTLGVAKLATKIPARLVGALAGHSIHQTIAVGLPTFAREMVGIGVMHAMRAQPESTVLGVQLSVAVVNIAAQLGREVRELRNPDVAARAYHSLSAEQWAAKSPEEQVAMRGHHRRMSRTITLLQVGASALNIQMMYAGLAAKDNASALRPLANEVKVGVYAAMRDGIQASFELVGFKPSPTAEKGHEFAAGMSGAAHAASAATYAAANAGTSYLSDALMGAWVPERGSAVATLMSSTATNMSHAEAWKTIALGAGVSAMTNTLAETIDWFQRMEHFVNQTGATQHFEAKLTGTDYGRLLDQAPARAAAFNGIFSVLTFAGGKMATETALPPAVQQFIGNAGLGVMIAMLDSPVSGIWQADQAVREKPVPGPSATLTEVEEGTDTVPSSGEVSQDSRESVSAGNPPERRRSRSPSPD
jgi:hypothetical protein